MRTFKRYSFLYWIYFKQHVKVMMEYRVDFLIGIASVFLQQFAAIFFIKVVFDHIETLKGWSFYEILLIYGIAFMGRSIHHIFFDNLWTLGWQYVRSGNLDRLLIRPINPLFQVIAERVQQDGIGQLLIGGIVLYTSISHLDITFDAWDVLLLIVMILSSGFIFVAINLFFITFSFWMTDSLPVVFAVFNLADFARYPMTIYNKFILFVLTFIIPYGFTAFYPASAFFDGGYKTIAYFTPLVALLSCVLAYAFWQRGLKAFASTGS
jgi:ABC-2 type transport system permease protein